MMDRRELLCAGAALAVTGCATPRLRMPASDMSPLSTEDRAAHVGKVQAGLQSAKIAALVVEPGATMRYLSGVSWWPSERAFLSIVPAEGRLRWIAPAFEEARARE